MASTLNIDWLLDLARGRAERPRRRDLAQGPPGRRRRPRARRPSPAACSSTPTSRRRASAAPSSIPRARAQFFGLSHAARLRRPDAGRLRGPRLRGARLLRGHGADPDARSGSPAARRARRRCAPSWAARSDADIRTSTREEAGAAGAAMMAAVALGALSRHGSAAPTTGWRRCCEPDARPDPALGASATTGCSRPMWRPARRASRSGTRCTSQREEQTRWRKVIAIVGDRFMLPRDLRRQDRGGLRAGPRRSARSNSPGRTCRWSTAMPARRSTA